MSVSDCWKALRYYYCCLVSREKNRESEAEEKISLVCSKKCGAFLSSKSRRSKSISCQLLYIVWSKSPATSWLYSPWEKDAAASFWPRRTACSCHDRCCYRNRSVNINTDAHHSWRRRELCFSRSEVNIPPCLGVLKKTPARLLPRGR